MYIKPACQGNGTEQVLSEQKKEINRLQKCRKWPWNKASCVSYCYHHMAHPSITCPACGCLPITLAGLATSSAFFSLSLTRLILFCELLIHFPKEIIMFVWFIKSFCLFLYDKVLWIWGWFLWVLFYIKESNQVILLIRNSYLLLKAEGLWIHSEWLCGSIFIFSFVSMFHLDRLTLEAGLLN